MIAGLKSSLSQTNYIVLVLRMCWTIAKKRFAKLDRCAPGCHELWTSILGCVVVVALLFGHLFVQEIFEVSVCMKAKPIYAKVGTQPMLILVDRGTYIKVGNKVKFREIERGSKWQEGTIDNEVPLRISLL